MEVDQCVKSLGCINLNIGYDDLLNITYKNSELYNLLDNLNKKDMNNFEKCSHFYVYPIYYILKCFLKEIYKRHKNNTTELNYEIKNIDDTSTNLYLYIDMKNYQENPLDGNYYLRFDYVNYIWYLSCVSDDIIKNYLFNKRRSQLV